MMDPNETNLPLEEGKLEENETVVAETVTDGQPSDTEETLNTEEIDVIENEDARNTRRGDCTPKGNSRRGRCFR